MSIPSHSGAPSIHIEPGAHAPGGRTCVLRVHARNLATGPRRLTFTLLGLDGDWLPVPVRTGAVAADATVTVELEVPIAAGAVPGTYPFALAVEADAVAVGDGVVPAQRNGVPTSATTMVEGELRVDAPSTVMLGVEPAESEGVLARNVHVVLSNSGDQPALLRLEARPEKGLRVSLDDERPRLPAHSTVRIPARLSMRPQVVGHRSRRTFTVSAHGDQAPARFQGVYTSKPMVGSGAIRLLAMALVVVVWVTGVIVTLPWLTDRLTGTEVVAAGQDAGGDDGTGDGSGAGAGGGSGDGSGSGGSGSDDGSGEDDEVVDDGVRIGGVVGGSDPGGVQVRVAPASVLGRTGAEAGSAGGEGSASTVADASGGAVVHTAALARTARAGTGAAGGGFGKIPAEALTLVRTETVAAERTTSTQDDGTWAFAGMSPNVNYLITLSKPGYQTQRYVMSGTEAAAAPLEVEMVAGAGSMSGRITGPSGPVGGATVTLTDGTTTVTTSTSTTGDVGYWSVDGLSTPSTYLVSATGPGLGQQSALVDLGAGETRTLDLRLFTGVASLAGTVTGPDSLGVVGGLGGITVTATDGATTRTASTVTGNRAGTFVLADLPVPATYTVTFSGDGYASQTHEVELAQGSSAALLDVLLDVSSGVVQGAVKDTAGLGLGGAGLTLTDGEHTYKTMSTSDAEGSYRFNGIAPGDYVLTGETFGHVNAYAPVTVERGGVATADLVLTPISGDGLVSTSRIRGRVSDARTNGQITCPGIDPGEVCEVTASMTAQAMDGSTRNISVTVAPDLEYTIPAAGDEGLLPGLYTLTISAPGYESGEVKVQVPMGQTVVASQVALYPSPSIVGTILTRVGAVPADTCVIAVRDGVDPGTVGDCDVGGDPTEPTCTITGDARCAGVAVNGSYALERLSGGTYQVSVQPGGDEYVAVPAVPVSLAPGDIRRYDATLDRKGRVFFTVLSDTGSSVFEPASGAEVTPVLIVGGTETALAAETTDADGRVLVTGLAPGTYRFDVTWEDTGATPAVELTASSQEMTVGNNQELSNQVVLTRVRSAFTSRVVTHLGSSGAAGAGGVTVTLNGIIGYSGLVPIWLSASTQTDADGYFHVQPTATVPMPPNTMVLPLAADQVNVEVNDSRYLPYSRNGAGVTALTTTPIEIQPRGQNFSGTLVLQGDTGTADATETQFRIDQAPPGALGAQIAALADGSLVWVDPSQPQNEDTAHPSDTKVRPGSYRITASLEGFDPATVNLTVPVGSAAPPLTVTLNKFGRLRVGIVAADADGVVGPVMNPTVTLIRPLQGNVTTAAIPGTSTVDFGEMASGTYQVHVQAPGYTTEPQSVALDPGNTAVIPVTITKLGSISGKVTVGVGGNVRALPNVVVTATPATGGGQAFTAVTDATGTYRITGTATEPGLAEGTWQITAALHGYRMDFPAGMGGVFGQQYWDVQIDPAEDEVQNIPMVAGLVDLTVDLYDPDKPEGDQPVSGMTVVLHGPAGTTNPTCTPSSAPPADCPTPTPGRYVFGDIEPGTYTLDAYGLGYAPLMVNVTVTPGESTHVNIPIATRTNTISGTVSGQAGAAAAQPLQGATVTLRTDEATPTVIGTFTTLASGAFSFTGVPDGAFVIEVDHGDYTSAARSVHVQGGQSASVDIVLFTEARQVTVTVSSTQGFDLTGALVSLLPGEGQLAVAAQPAVRVAGTSTYRTTFNQVPPGAWTASVSGPAGHYGTFTTAVAAGDDAVTVDVDEVRLRLVATASATGAPSTLAVTVEDANDAVVTTQSVGVNGGATVIYLERDDYDVTATKPSGWSAAPTAHTVDDSDTDLTATFVLTKDAVGTTTTLGAEPAAVVQGGNLTLTADVSAAGPDPDDGTVTFYRDGTSIGTADVSDGEATLTVATTGWALGSRSLTAEFGGSADHSASTSSAVAVTVEATTTTTITVDDAAVETGDTVTFTVGVSSSVAGTIAGTITVYREAGPNDVVIDDVDASGGTVTWTATVGSHEFYAEFEASSGSAYRDSASTSVDVEVTDP